MNLVEEAILFATEAHCGQMRKSVKTPYILHPMEVANICATITTDQEVLAAAILHDTVEDTDVTLDQLRQRFGERVAMLVDSETEKPHPELPRAVSWALRKEEALRTLEQTTDLGVKILWLGDKLSNVRSFYRQWLVHGHGLWAALNQRDPARQAWYYRRIVTLLEDLKDTLAWQELRYDVEQIFRDV